MPVFVFYNFRIIRYRKWVIKQMGASLFEGAMGHGPASEQRWHRGEGKDNDTGSPIGSGMTEESGGLGKGKEQMAA